MGRFAVLTEMLQVLGSLVQAEQLHPPRQIGFVLCGKETLTMPSGMTVHVRHQLVTHYQKQRKG